ncbi:MAG: Holliday junction branch migration protein RuvA [Victivallales bacterium]|nr:Holliday junction branch migration protein RuvA [Victivallales bacterium]
MIAQLTGTLVENTMDSVILDVHGVGYELLIPLSTAEKLPTPHATLTLFTYLAVREDALTLYGFLTREEKRLFSLIVNDVKGFGARLALNVLSAMGISAFCTAIASQDIKLLSKISGVGKKSAAQLVLDLKGKLGDFGGALPTAGGTAPGALDAAASDAVKALATLGFKQNDAETAIRELVANDPDRKLSTSALITKALARMTAAKPE